MVRPVRLMPEDFARYAAIEGNLKLRKRFNMSGRMVERFRKELGLRFAKPISDKPVRTIIVARKRIKARIRTMNERIEDLDGWVDFDAAEAVGYRRYGGGW